MPREFYIIFTIFSLTLQKYVDESKFSTYIPNNQKGCNNKMIEIKNLYKTFKKGTTEVQALKNINLSIKEGGIHGIIGLSGAGKSTLVRCINLIEKPTLGEIFINDINITSLKSKELREVRKNIGMIFQSFNLLNSKTVSENIAFPLKLNKVNKKETNKKVSSLLDLVELNDKGISYPSQLSGGQKQRVGIARALANNPNILLCDEATSALDPKTTKQILRLLKDINKKLNITIVVITHEMEVIKEICDTVSIMENGNIIEEGSVIDIFSSPCHNTTKHFVTQDVILPRSITGKTILNLSFTNNSAHKPIISNLIKNFDIDLNILCGNIEYVQDTAIGKLLIEVSSYNKNLDQVIDYLQNNDVKVEVLNNE